MPDTAGTIEQVEVFGHELTYAHGSPVMSEGRVLDALPSTIGRVDEQLTRAPRAAARRRRERRTGGDSSLKAGEG